MSEADTLPSPALALPLADHMLGSAHTTVTLLEYGDYECPFCIRAEPLTQALIEASGPRLRFVFRHLPLMQLHAHAELAAEAAEAAAAQGYFWAMHHLIFTQARHLDLPVLASCAQSIGLDMNRFNAEMADRVYTQRVHEHRQAAEQDKVHTTPSYLLNGLVIDVSQGFDRLDRAVAAALKGH
jgi:protein-disulfide isomerase